MTEVQSNTGVGRPLPVPTREELPPLLARTPLAIIDEALTFLRINPALFFGLTTAVVIPLQLLILVLPGSSLRGNRPDRTADIIFGSLDQPGAVANGIGTLVFESLSLFVVATIFGQLAASWYSGESMSTSQLLRASVKRIPKAIGAWTVAHFFILTAGIFTFGTMGVLVGTFFIVAAPVMGAEDLGIGESLKRSRVLATSKLGHSLIMYVIVAVAGLVIDSAVRLAPTFILSQVDIPAWISNGVFDVVASIIVVSFTAATSVVLYLDLRVRREGIDLYMAVDQKFRPSRIGGNRG